MDQTTLQALADFPGQLEAHFAQIPPAFRNWRPASWDGVPSEPFSAIEQICHVRDIEIDGYHERFRRVREESHPSLASVDGEALAEARQYTKAEPAAVFGSIRAARTKTLTLIAQLTPDELRRTAVFGNYGVLTLRSLVHYLCSHDQQHLAGLQWLLGRIAASEAHSAPSVASVA